MACRVAAGGIMRQRIGVWIAAPYNGAANRAKITRRRSRRRRRRLIKRQHNNAYTPSAYAHVRHERAFPANTTPRKASTPDALADAGDVNYSTIRATYYHATTFILHNPYDCSGGNICLAATAIYLFEHRAINRTAVTSTLLLDNALTLTLPRLPGNSCETARCAAAER